MTARKITLDEMLDCREKRAGQQKEMRLRFKTVLVSVTVVWPGEVKDTDASGRVLGRGVNSEGW